LTREWQALSSRHSGARKSASPESIPTGRRDWQSVVVGERLVTYARLWLWIPGSPFGRPGMTRGESLSSHSETVVGKAPP